MSGQQRVVEVALRSLHAVKDLLHGTSRFGWRTYGEHFRVASHFAKEMFVASLACAVHAVNPRLFTNTASSKIQQLHAEMAAGGDRRNEIAAATGDNRG